MALISPNFTISPSVSFGGRRPSSSRTPAAGAPTQPELSWSARRNLARQIDELTITRQTGVIRELMNNDLTRARVMSVISLCTDATVQLLAANAMLLRLAADPAEHTLITRNLALAETTVRQIIIEAYR